MKMRTQEFPQTPDQAIEGYFGQEIIHEAEGISKEILEQMKVGILSIGMLHHEWNPQQQEQEVKRYLKMWREFSNGLFARTSSANATSPEVVETAIKGANSLLSVEPTSGGNESAKMMKAALEKRYQ